MNFALFAFLVSVVVSLLSFTLMAFGFPSFHVGVAWFILTMYVPLLLVNHVVIFWFLLRVLPSAARITPAPGEEIDQIIDFAVHADGISTKPPWR